MCVNGDVVDPSDAGSSRERNDGAEGALRRR